MTRRIKNGPLSPAPAIPKERSGWLLYSLACAVAIVVATHAAEPERLLCLGDSIRIGWAAHLRCQQPAVNCGNSRFMLQHLGEWSKGRWAIVVFNSGLHDIDSRERVTVSEYQDNLWNIARELQARSDRVFFCATTEGVEGDVRGRNPEAVMTYNCAALGVMRDLRIPVIELWQMSRHHPEWKLADGIHYTDDGYRGLAAVIKESLSDRSRR